MNRNHRIPRKTFNALALISAAVGEILIENALDTSLLGITDTSEIRLNQARLLALIDQNNIEQLVDEAKDRQPIHGRENRHHNLLRLRELREKLATAIHSLNHINLHIVTVAGVEETILFTRISRGIQTRLFVKADRLTQHIFRLEVLLGFHDLI